MQRGVAARLDAMRGLKIAAGVVFVAFVPMLLITTNARLVINFPGLYSYGFDRYDIPRRTGIERAELIDAGRQIRTYFNDDTELLDVRVFVGGTRRSIYGEREVLHMRDVKGLVRGVYAAQYIAAAYMAVFLAVCAWLLRREALALAVRLLSYGGLVTLGLAALVGLGSLVGFDRLFLAFHLVSFSNDLWQLDPRRHMLLAMFPQGFFFDATMLIALLTVVEAGILAFAGWLQRRRKEMLTTEGAEGTEVKNSTG